MTRITKRLKLPNVTAYIVAGILMGPYCLNLIPVGLIERMDFIADIALAFIAFNTGEFFRFSTLKKSGVKVLFITFLEACLASIAVFIATHYVLGLDMVFSVVLAGVELLHLSGRITGGDEISAELYLAVRRVIDAGYDVERRRLSGAVRTDERDDLALVYLHREVVDRDDAAELHRDVAHG